MTRLSAALRAAADEPHDLDLDAVHDRADRRRRRRVRARAGACVVGALVVVAGIGLAAGAGDRGADVRAGEPEGPGVEEPGGEGSGGEASTTEPPASTETTTESTTTTTSTTTTPVEEPTTTTTTEAPSTTEPPPPSTTAPAPSVLHLHGTYVGTGTTGIGDRGCPELSGTMRRTVVMDDDSRWEMGEDVCATIDDGMWVADGTFFLKAPDGSTLTGPYVISTPMATPGVPYTLTSTAGTGAFAGATGVCDVTIDITPPGGLAQEQRGEVTCTITLAP